MSRASASFQLKASTDDLHRRLDSASMLAGLVLPSLTADRYALMLEHIAMAWDGCLYLFNAGWGGGQSDETWINPDWFILRARLDEDLERLNGSVPPIRESDRPRLDLNVSDRHEMAGLAYVLNGSRLGARVIAKKLRAHSDPSIRAATRHFAAADVAGPDWACFKRRLDQELCTPEAINSACRAASRTYQLWLDVMMPGDVEAAEKRMVHA